MKFPNISQNMPTEVCIVLWSLPQLVAGPGKVTLSILKNNQNMPHFHYLKAPRSRGYQMTQPHVIEDIRKKLGFLLCLVTCWNSLSELSYFFQNKSFLGLHCLFFGHQGQKKTLLYGHSQPQFCPSTILFQTKVHCTLLNKTDFGKLLLLGI